MNRPRPLAIDCDPGLDDAIAIALAAASPELSLELITTVEGNAPLEMVTANACSVIAALSLSTPVHRGHRAPRPDPTRLSAAIWGGDGSLELAPGLPPPASRGDAVMALDAWLDRVPEKQATIIAIGPLSNLARLLRHRPGFGQETADLLIMGGAIGRGNATPEAELNIWVDPESAAAVLAASVPARIVPLDITRNICAGRDFARTLIQSDTRSAKLVASLLPMAGIGSHPAAIHDACVVGLLLWPELFQLERGVLRVVTERGPSEGRTLWRRDSKGPHGLVVALDRDRFLERMAQRLAGREEA